MAELVYTGSHYDLRWPDSDAVTPIPKDRNCLFHAPPIRARLRSSRVVAQVDHVELRRELVNHIADNWSEFQADVHDEHRMLFRGTIAVYGIATTATDVGTEK